MEATYFGDPAAPLFGLYHPAGGSRRRDCGVLLCPPIGHEHVRAHRALRQLAALLSREGFEVLRFDYFGVGDSAGRSDEARLARWQGDVAAAGAELQAVSGVDRLVLVGLRLGAALAATGSAGLPVERLVLWDPVTSGRSLVERWQGLHRNLVGDERFFPRPRQDGSDGLLGCAFPLPLRQDLAKLDLATLDPWPSRRISVVASSPGAEAVALVEALRARQLFAELVLPSTPGTWDNLVTMEKAFVPGDAQAAVLAAATKDWA